MVCVDNKGYEASLERRKIYGTLPDAKAEKLGQIRMLDESGEDYLYDRESFVEVPLPRSVWRSE